MSDSNIHAILKDKSRRKIIEMIGEQGKVGFKEFKDNLNIGVGTLYYHLDILSEFVVQDKSRKYILNERGALLYRAVKEGSIPTALKLDKVSESRVLRLLSLTPILSKINNPIKWFPLSVFTLIIGSVGAGLARLEPLFLFYTTTTNDFEQTMLYFIFGWIGAFFLADIFANLFYKRTGDDLNLFVCMGIAGLPLAIYPYLYIVILMFVPTVVVVYILRSLLLIIQIWSLILLTSAFSYGKGLRLERAAILTLSILYSNIMLLILLGNLRVSV